MTINDNCTEKIRILRFENDSLIEMEDQVLREKSYTLYLNGKQSIKFNCTAKEIRELAVGYLFCEAHINSPADLKSLEIHHTKCLIEAEIKSISQKTKMPLSQSTPPVNLEYNAIISALSKFQEMSKLFQDTGGVHSAALLDQKYDFRYFAEDMGRYNALEKVIGKAFLDNFKLSEAILMVSSRMPLELIQKAYSAGLRIIVSISAPTLESIGFARENNIILAGMFRGKRINIYSYE